MAKDEGLLRRAAEFRAENVRFNKAFALGGADLAQWNGALVRAQGDYWEHLASLKRGDPDALEPVLNFLETHPRFFRSGYLAEWMIKAILREPRWQKDTVRITTIALGILDDGPSRELRMAAKLASTVWGPHLRNSLDARQRVAESDRDIAAVRRIEFFRDQAFTRYETFHSENRSDRQAGHSTERRLERWRATRRRRMYKVLRSTHLAEYGAEDDAPEHMSHECARTIAERVMTRIENGVQPFELANAIELDVAELHGPVSDPEWSINSYSLSKAFCALAAGSRPPT